MYTTVILEYIVNASNIGNDSNFMEMDNLEEYIFIGSLFGHYLYKCGNLVYLFFIERDNFLLSSFYASSEKNDLKREDYKNYRKKTYDREEDIYIHRWRNKVTFPKLEYIENRKFWKYFFFLLYFPYTRFYTYYEVVFIFSCFLRNLRNLTVCET